MSALLVLAGAAALAPRATAHESGAPAVRPPDAGRLEVPAPVAGTYALPALGDAADGEVLDASGRTRRLHELYADRVVLLSFVYSSCADADGCPLALAVMDRLRSRIAADPELASRTRLLTLSFDPERDTPEVMRAYGAGFRSGAADWRFLTSASTRAVAPILAAYGQPVQRERNAHGEASGRFAHILRVYLIDPEQRIRNVYSSSYLHAEVLESDLRTLLLEDAAAEVAAAGAAGARSASAAPNVDLFARVDAPPLGLPAVPVPADNPLTRRKIALGRKLFFDRRLSHNDTMSCAMCHIPEQGFTNRQLATAVGIEGRTVRRNAPTLYNVAYAKRLFHDAREGRLERQVWGPLLARNEMGNPSVGSVIERIESLPDYAGLFEVAFDGRPPGMKALGMALASYQRTLLAGDSAFDRAYFGGEGGALSKAAARGFRLFTDEAACAACHPVGAESALFTDHGLHNTGVGYRSSLGTGAAGTRVEVAPGSYVELEHALLASISETPPADLGVYEITLDPRDRWKYRTPSLRNVALTAPYMHDGSLRTLREVVEFYDRGGVPNEALDPLMRPLGLTQTQIDDLVAFLESLTGDVNALVRDARAAPIGDRR